MKITFFSNFMNHHQLPFSKAMSDLDDVDYTFVATTPIESEKLNFGYEDMNKKYPFVLTTYDSEKNSSKAMNLALDSDVIIIGSAPQKYILKRMKKGKLTFQYSERPFKTKQYEVLPLKLLASFWINHTRFCNRPIYMLCASAYTAADFAKAGAYINRTYKWGYFPEVKKYDNINKIIEKKEKNSLLWVARFIELKHPELMIMLAKKLKEENFDFKIRMIGTGLLENDIRQQIIDKHLEDYIEVLGSMSPEKVREHMENSQIFLFTSDFNEGWGAVMNESMNSGCAVIASHAIGSVPFLIKDGENGVIYKNGDFEDLFEKVKFLLGNDNDKQKMGFNAYKTLTDKWNADVAAERLLILAREIADHGYCDLFTDGPCSRAEIIRDEWY